MFANYKLYWQEGDARDKICSYDEDKICL